MIKSDRWIKQMALEHGMITPFAERQVREGAISYGVSSYGYDLRISDEFKIFTNIHTTIVDPKAFDPRSFVDFRGPICVIPPNSFALGRSVEYFRIPRNVMTICVGKCVAGATRVVDASSGRLVPIEDLFAREAATASLQGGALGRAQVTEGVRQGTLPLWRLTTRTGRVLRATPHHPLLTYGGWRELRELAPGHRIGVARRIPVFGERSLPTAEVDLLGLVIADGQGATPSASPPYTGGDPVLREYFADAVSRLGCVRRPVARVSVNATNRGRRGVMERNRLAAWLDAHGLAVRSPDKAVPTVVFELRPALLARFLRALFSGDGGISIGGEGIHLEYSTASERLARDVQHLLLRFEIVSFLRARATRSGRPAFVLTVTSTEHLGRFGERIGFVPGTLKQRRLEEALEKIRREPQWKSSFDTLPREAWASVREACRQRGVSMRQAGLPQAQPRQSLPRPLVREIAARLDHEGLGRLADSDLLWDTVEEIRPDGWGTVYDLTLPETANFLADDVVVHNSTYARCGIITNVTPFEPEWEGYVTLEISNTTPLPARIYANEGIAQVLFFESDEPCETSYADRKGKYQAQQGIVLPTV